MEHLIIVWQEGVANGETIPLLGNYFQGQKFKYSQEKLINIIEDCFNAGCDALLKEFDASTETYRLRIVSVWVVKKEIV